MTPKDLLLALLVIVVWGLNFVVIKVGLHGMPPMLMGALRFMLAAFPAILFVRRPQVPLRWMLAYGMTISVGQFAFLFYAMHVGMPAGLASLVLQSQAFFTLFFAALFLGERLRGSNLFGLLVAASGLVLIGLQGGQAMTLAGFALTIAAASNRCCRHGRRRGCAARQAGRVICRAIAASAGSGRDSLSRRCGRCRAARQRETITPAWCESMMVAPASC